MTKLFKENIDVFSKLTKDRIRKAHKRYENKKVDSHAYGLVKAVNADGSYQVQLNASATTARCANFCTANVGDRVEVVIKANGKCDVIGRLGGTIGGGGGSAITVQCSEAFNGSNAEARMSLGTVVETLGDDFTTQDGGVVCNFTGHVLASFSAYVRTSVAETKQFDIRSNGKTVASFAYYDGNDMTLTQAPVLIAVSEGDVIQVFARTWTNSCTFTIRADNMTRMTVERVSAGGSSGSGGGEPVVYSQGDVSDWIAGKVFAYAGTSEPIGCLPCDGRAVSRREYWELFNAIGTTYGAGDGSTTFNLPNIESRTIIGESTSYKLGAKGGEEKHKQTVDEMPAHEHRAHSVAWLSPSTADAAYVAMRSAHYSNQYGTELNSRVAEAGGSQPFNVMQPYIVMRYFITTGKGDPVSGINPADYVVEWGKTGEWTWRKYASGIAECWLTKTWTTSSAFSAWGNGYISIEELEQRAYPFEFVDYPTVSADFRTVDRDWSMVAVVSMGDKTKSPVVNGFRPSAMNPGYELTWQASVHAIGPIKQISSSGGTETIAPTIEERFEGIEADIDLLKTNKVLWSGIGEAMHSGQTATLSEAVSAQPNGIMLVWSAYADGAAQNYDWFYAPVPKHHVINHGGTGVGMFLVTPDGGRAAGKYVYVSDTKVVGNDNNYADAAAKPNGITMTNKHWGLRYIIGY